MKLRTRHLIRRDLPEVHAIENEAFARPWSPSEFLDKLRTPKTFGMVAEYDEAVVGYMVYHLHAKWVELLTLAVHHAYRRHGVGSVLIERLATKLTRDGRSRIVIGIDEYCLSGQLFLAANGFAATDIWHGYYDYGDAYIFEYDISRPAIRFGGRFAGVT